MTRKDKKRHLIKKAIKGAVIICLLIAGTGMYYHYRTTILDVSENNIQMRQELDQYQTTVKDYQDEIARLNAANEKLREENKDLRYKVGESHREVNRGYSRAINVEVTAYTLSESSCNKGTSHPSYGITANGTNLAGHTLWSARAIAVDPNVIPLGSKVHISFEDESMQKYNGIYTACDTGGAIRGNIIDLFAGENAEDLAMHIGRRKAVAKIVKA